MSSAATLGNYPVLGKHAAKLNQPRAGDEFSRMLAEYRIVAQRCANGRRSEILADGGVVLVANHQECRYRNIAELIENRLRIDHVVDQRRVPGYQLLARAVV